MRAIRWGVQRTITVINSTLPPLASTVISAD
jgi:hypothetical protein